MINVIFQGIDLYTNWERTSFPAYFKFVYIHIFLLWNIYIHQDTFEGYTCKIAKNILNISFNLIHTKISYFSIQTYNSNDSKHENEFLIILINNFWPFISSQKFMTYIALIFQTILPYNKSHVCNFETCQNNY